MQNIPSFPFFRKISLDDRGWYERFVSNYPPYADFSFSNLIIWLDAYDDLQISQLHGNIILKCTNLFLGDLPSLTFLGKNRVSEVIHAIFSYQQSEGQPLIIKNVPAVNLSRYGSADTINFTDFVAVHDRDNDEYVVDVHDLIGNRHLKKSVKYFTRDMKERLWSAELDLRQVAVKRLLINSSMSWQAEISSHELRVLRRTLRYSEELEYKNLTIFDNDRVIGFVLYRMLPQKAFAIVNHAKTNYPSYKNSFTYITWLLALQISQKGSKYVNVEQDLGIPGLRAYKERLEPAYFLRKYTITPQ